MSSRETGQTLDSSSRLPRILLALSAAALAAGAVLAFAVERRERAAVESFVSRFRLDARKPDDVGAVRLEPVADLAAAIAVNASVAEPFDAASRAADIAGTRDDESAAARDLMLDAIRRRPGWPYHRFLLGEVAYGIGRRTPGSSARQWEAWTTPLRLAAAGAPGLDATWSALGGIYLDNWPNLSAAQRTEAIGALRRAIQDPRFVSSRFSRLSEAMGSEEAARLLPDSPELLGAAAEALSVHGDLAAAAGVLARREAAAKRTRAEGLGRIEDRYRRGDKAGLSAACFEWASDHPVLDLDDPAGRAQAARVLELWPGDRGGPWDGDPRSDLVRFFLDGRESAVGGQILLRSIGALSDVPDLVTARIRLLAGGASAAQEIAARPENQGGPEWSVFYSDLAHHFLKEGRAREARGALDLVPLAARDDCEALIARRDVARALHDAAELANIAPRLDSLKGAPKSADVAPGGATISVCVDPELAAGRSLAITLTPQSPAIVAYGWGGGRAGTVFLQNERAVSLPLTGLSGRRDVTMRALAGGDSRASVAVPGR